MKTIIAILIALPVTVLVWAIGRGGAAKPDAAAEPEIQQDEFVTSIQHWGKIHERRLH